MSQRIASHLPAIPRSIGPLSALAAAALLLAQTTPPVAPEPPIPVGNARTDASKAAAQKSREALLQKPLTLTGKTLEGKDFSTAQWKGKVVLIDFWASWCPDCQAELPKVLDTYRKFHDQGLELLGISSDITAEDFRDYLKAHPEIAWPQLWSKPLDNGRHPLNTTYGVDWIPTIFLIDKAGICRSVNGSADLAKLLPELLKEKSSP